MKKIPLSGKHGKGKFALVDNEDYPVLSRFTWSLAEGYPQTWINRHRVLMHHFLMRRGAGMQYKYRVIDHINRIPSDNRKKNLRWVPNSWNNQNRTKMEGASSKYVGVRRVKKKKPWSVAIRIKGKKRYIGSFANEIEAAKKYDQLARTYYGEYAFVNFPKKK